MQNTTTPTPADVFGRRPRRTWRAETAVQRAYREASEQVAQIRSPRQIQLDAVAKREARQRAEHTLNHPSCPSLSTKRIIFGLKEGSR